ncbi:TonB-dependent siderophore receptor [Sodalis ligni]|uniref:TonB-dependent receptor n=1 Tax=Sodalis ligni TaxID=2697027 RepID=UPI00193F425E|nr:TonB-dependent siderophore receptor [Sodalis ligni]QWA10897.1 TonB-dependent siderophore receptor [Sodalis ligni]
MRTAVVSTPAPSGALPRLLAVIIGAACGTTMLPVFAATTADTTSTATSSTAASAAKGETMTVVASPNNEFRAGGDQLVPAFLDGPIANGGRVGFLGQQDANNVPFSVVGFTSKLMQDQQTRSISDVLRNDASVQTAYGYGSTQEIFNIRGFKLASEDISYGGLYGVLPRQFVATEIAERVELLKGASAFLNGVPPGGTGVGGNINIEPKRAGDEPLNRVSLDYTSKSQIGGSFDVARRYGDDNQWGVRVSGVHREGETAIDDENRRLTLGTLGLDYRGDRFRASLDAGAEKQTIHGARSVVYTTGLDEILKPPSATTNYGQKWAFTDTESQFGALRGEYDLSNDWTVYGAVGGNHTHEYGSYSSPTPFDDNGDATMGQMRVPYFSDSFSSQAGVRGKFDTGFITHHVNLGYSSVWTRIRTAYQISSSSIATNIYDPSYVDEPTDATYAGGRMGDPGATSRTFNSGVSLSDSLSMLDDRLQLIGGLRRQSVNVSNYDYTGVESSKFTETKVTPAFGLVVKPWQHISLYANHIEALQSGETAGASYGSGVVVNGGQVTGIETSKQNEVGVKVDYGRIAGSLAAFEIKKPVASYNYLGDNQYEYGNYGEERNRGLELNLFGEPLLGVRLNGSATWMDPELTKTQDGAYDGNDAIGVPRYQLVLGGEWDLPRLNGVAATGRVIRSGSQYADQANDLKVKGWTRLDLGLRYDMQLPKNNIVWRANVENVTNENYWASASDGYLTQGDPRSLKLSMTVDF